MLRVDHIYIRIHAHEIPSLLGCCRGLEIEVFTILDIYRDFECILIFYQHISLNTNAITFTVYT